MNGVVRRQSYLQDDELSIANLIAGERAEIVLTPNSLQFEVNGQHVQASHVTIDATGITLGGVRRTTWPTGGGGGGGIADVSGQGLYARIEDPQGNRNWSRLIIGSNLSISYGRDGGTPTWTLNADNQSGGGGDRDTTLSVEQVEDIVESLFTHGEHEGIAFAYDDANDRIEATVSGSSSLEITINTPPIDIDRKLPLFCVGESSQFNVGFVGAFSSDDTLDVPSVPFDVDIAVQIFVIGRNRLNQPYPVLLEKTSMIANDDVDGIGTPIDINALDFAPTGLIISPGSTPFTLGFFVSNGTIRTSATPASTPPPNTTYVDAPNRTHPFKLLYNLISIRKSVNDLTIIERGDDSFEVSLSLHAGSRDVVISLVSSDTTKMTVSPATLTFTEDNFDDPQTVTVTALEDSQGTQGVNLSYTLEGKTWTDSVAVEIVGRFSQIRLEYDPNIQSSVTDPLMFLPWGESFSSRARLLDPLLENELIRLSPFSYDEVNDVQIHGDSGSPRVVFNPNNWSEWQDINYRSITKNHYMERLDANPGSVFYDPVIIRFWETVFWPNPVGGRSLVSNITRYYLLVGTPVTLRLPANITASDAGTSYTITPASNPVATQIEWEIDESTPSSGTLTIPANSVTPVTFLSEPDDAVFPPSAVRLTVSDPEVSQYQTASRVFLL